MKHNLPLWIVTEDGVFYSFYWYFEISPGVPRNIPPMTSPLNQVVIPKKIPSPTKIAKWTCQPPKEGSYLKYIQGINDCAEDNKDNSNGMTKRKIQLGSVLFQ